MFRRGPCNLLFVIPPFLAATLLVLQFGGQSGIVTAWLHAQAATPRKDGTNQPKVEQLWDDLGSGDAAVGHKAIWSLVDDPDRAVPFLKKMLTEMPPSETERRIAKLIEQLDADEFAARANASKELRRFGRAALPAVEQALANHPSTEARRRLERLRGRRAPRPLTIPAGDPLRAARAVEVLERIGTADARAVLRAVATDRVSDASRAARDALDRHAAQAGEKP